MAGRETAGIREPLWVVLHARQVYEVGPLSIYFSYPLLPWIGVMLVGYASAGLFQGPARLRDERLLRIGIGLVLGFVLLRALDIYGDPHHWHFDPDNIAATRHVISCHDEIPAESPLPADDLGPAAIVCAFAERLRGGIRDVLVTFGRAPLAFYVAHLYLIHAVALLLGVAQGFAAQQFLTHYRYFPKGYGVGLGGVYLIWIAVVVTLVSALSLGGIREGAAHGLVAQLHLIGVARLLGRPRPGLCQPRGKMR